MKIETTQVIEISAEDVERLIAEVVIQNKEIMKKYVLVLCSHPPDQRAADDWRIDRDQTQKALIKALKARED